MDHEASTMRSSGALAARPANRCRRRQVSAAGSLLYLMPVRCTKERHFSDSLLHEGPEFRRRYCHPVWRRYSASFPERRILQGTAATTW